MAGLFKKKPKELPAAAGDLAVRNYRKQTKDPRKKKERIKQKLAIAAKLASQANTGTTTGTAGSAAAAKKKVVFSGDSILASIGL